MASSLADPGLVKAATTPAPPSCRHGSHRRGRRVRREPDQPAASRTAEGHGLQVPDPLGMDMARDATLLRTPLVPLGRVGALAVTDVDDESLLHRHAAGGAFGPGGVH